MCARSGRTAARAAKCAARAAARAAFVTNCKDCGGRGVAGCALARRPGAALRSPRPPSPPPLPGDSNARRRRARCEAGFAFRPHGASSGARRAAPRRTTPRPPPLPSARTQGYRPPCNRPRQFFIRPPGMRQCGDRQVRAIRGAHWKWHVERLEYAGAGRQVLHSQVPHGRRSNCPQRDPLRVFVKALWAAFARAGPDAAGQGAGGSRSAQSADAPGSRRSTRAGTLAQGFHTPCSPSGRTRFRWAGARPEAALATPRRPPAFSGSAR